MRKYQTLVSGVSGRSFEKTAPDLRWRRKPGDSSALGLTNPSFLPPQLPKLIQPRNQPAPDLSAFAQPSVQRIDPFYLFARYVEWEQSEDASAGWELISATSSTDGDTRAHARALLASSRHLNGRAHAATYESSPNKLRLTLETEMKTPYGIEIVENCAECPLTNESFFCGLSRTVREVLDQVSHKSVLPAGAILFVEGQPSRGMFIVCTGKVNLSTTSREGKTLILKSASAGEALGLSATISSTGYEATAETATPWHLNFVDRKNFLELMQSHSEIGVRAALGLSRDFRSAHKDIHDLVLTRSSRGKFARLLLSQFRHKDEN